MGDILSYCDIDVRVLFTSEIKMGEGEDNIKIDGNLVKNKLCSAGDNIDVRGLYEQPFRMTALFRLFMTANDLPPFCPPDSLQSFSKFTFPNEYLDEDEYVMREKMRALTDNTKHSDPNIKPWVCEQNVYNSFLSLVLEAYVDHPVIDCDLVKEETMIFREDVGDEKLLIYKYMSFTKNQKDFITTTDLQQFLKNGDLRMTITKLRMLLKMNGAIENKHCGRTKGNTGYRGFIGVKFL